MKLENFSQNTKIKFMSLDKIKVTMICFSWLGSVLRVDGGAGLDFESTHSILQVT